MSKRSVSSAVRARATAKPRRSARRIDYSDIPDSSPEHNCGLCGASAVHRWAMSRGTSLRFALNRASLNCFARRPIDGASAFRR